MKLYAIERSAVNATWKMRLYRWLDMKTLKHQFSVEVRDPEKRKWAHVYEDGEKWLKVFKSEAAANRYIAKLSEGAAMKDQPA